MSHKIYTTQSYGNIRNHIAIFIETEPVASDSGGGGGHKYHVTGNVLQGMTYILEHCDDPTTSPEHVPGTKKLIGTVKEADMGRFEAICEAVEVLGAQLLLDGKPKDATQPLRRCGEWVREVLAKLR